MLRYLLRTSALLLLAVSAPATKASELSGGTAAVDDSVFAVDGNPANGVRIDKSTLGFEGPCFTRRRTVIKYPGHPKYDHQETKIAPPLTLPHLALRPNRRWAVGAFFLPPLPFGQRVKLRDIPIYALGAVNSVDADFLIKVHGAGTAFAAFALSSRLSLGLGATFQSASFEGVVSAADSGRDLLQLRGDTTDATVTLGMRFDASERLSFGLAFQGFHYSNLNIEAEAVGQTLNFGEGGKASAGTPLNGLLAGMRLAPTTGLKVNLDAEYHRSASGVQTFSLVDLRLKEADVHPTLAGRIGLTLAQDKDGKLVFGGRYEPSAIGQGSQGEDGKAGFGSFQVIDMLALGSPLTPYWQVGGGLTRRVFAARSLEVGTGLVYRQASVGIDENGELPGAYVQSTWMIPVSLAYQL